MAKTNATTQAPLANVKKIDLARPIYQQVTAPGYDLMGKTARRVFIDRCVAELAMGEKGANTYFQNLKSEAETGVTYPYAKSAKNETAAPAPTHAQVATAEGQVLAQLQMLSTGMNKLNRQMTALQKQVAAGAAH